MGHWEKAGSSSRPPVVALSPASGLQAHPNSVPWSPASVPIPTFFFPFILLLSILSSFFLLLLSSVLLLLWGAVQGAVSGWLFASTHHHHQWQGALGGPKGWGREDGRSQRKDRTQPPRKITEAGDGGQVWSQSPSCLTPPHLHHFFLSLFPASFLLHLLFLLLQVLQERKRSPFSHYK